MKFRYYIVDLYDGKVVGTDNTEVADSHALSEDFFVIDAETGKWLQPDEAVEIEELQSPTSEERLNEI